MGEETQTFLKYTPDRSVRNCPFCDTENRIEANTCFLCGTNMLLRVEEEKKKKRWWNKIFDTEY